MNYPSSNDNYTSLSTAANSDEDYHHHRHQKLQYCANALAFSQDDVQALVNEQDAFRKLQKSLQQSGAITNSLLKQGLHFYIYDHAEKKNKNPNHPPPGKNKLELDDDDDRIILDSSSHTSTTYGLDESHTTHNSNDEQNGQHNEENDR